MSSLATSLAWLAWLAGLAGLAGGWPGWLAWLAWLVALLTLLYSQGPSLLALGLAMVLLYRLAARLMAPRRIGAQEDIDVIIVGAGVSGLCMGKKLRDQGVKFTILEKNSTLGGTWWENLYPGCGCDVPSHLYSFSFFPNPNWSRVFSGQQEILDYLRKMADRFSLTPHIQYGKRVVNCSWDNRHCVWEVVTEQGESLTARVLVSGQGALHVPKMPQVKGLEEFGGKAMHTARWDPSYNAEGRRIGVIGTGASAVQALPLLAKQAEHVTVFQRTPCWSPRRYDGPYAPWLKSLFSHLPVTMAVFRAFLFLRNELFFHLLIVTDRWYSATVSHIVHKWVRRNVGKVVTDPAVAAKLTPDYAMGCKRITPSDHYWKVFNRDNVKLVTEPIIEVCQEGVKTKDETFKVDTLVYATGFDLLASGYGFEITNKLGQPAREEFGAAPQGYLGICHPNYPNFYWLLGPGTGLGTNSIIFMIECQADFVVSCLRAMVGAGARAITVKEETLREYNRWSEETMKERTFGGRGTCDAWYKNSDGYNWTLWPADCVTYWWRTRKCQLEEWNMTK